MSLADPIAPPHRGTAAASAAPMATMRDPRLDFFRGIAMFIILIAHTPGNWATLWIPARFGFSDATEMFVFLSGMASAIAFGRVFAKRGLFMGTARVAYRVWQVYWAHIGLFFAVAAAMVALNATGLFERDYVGQLNLYPFFNGVERGDVSSSAANQFLNLLTLTYVPNYFDILPMYLVILAMMPIVVGLRNVHLSLAILFCVTLWLLAQEALQAEILTRFAWAFLEVPADASPALMEIAMADHGILRPLEFEFPAEPWSDREWFFNPFGWQLIFFTGFAFMAGWLPAPPVKVWLIALAMVVVVLTFMYSNVGARFYAREWLWFTNDAGNPVNAWRRDNTHWITKTDFGILRYTHFLALAYLAYIAAGAGGTRLMKLGQGMGAYVMAVIMKVGQQSLPVFLTSMFLARLMGVALDHYGRDSLANQLLVNVTGGAILIAVAFGVGWIKSQPWRAKKGAAT